jgi:hypothetical protein
MIGGGWLLASASFSVDRAEINQASFWNKRPRRRRLTPEQKRNIVLSMFSSMEANMLRVFVEEAAALASITLFVGMIAVWAQLFSQL